MDDEEDGIIDPQFDPLAALQQAQATIEELVKVVNTQAKFLEDLAKQHELLSKNQYNISVNQKEVTEAVTLNTNNIHQLLIAINSILKPPAK